MRSWHFLCLWACACSAGDLSRASARAGSGGFGPEPDAASGGEPGGSDGAAGSAGKAGGSGGSPSVEGRGGLCDVQRVMRAHCQACHSSPPLEGVPVSLVTYGDLIGPAKSDPSSRLIDLAIARMKDAAKPMPPPPQSAASSSDIQTLVDWVDAGLPGTCGPVDIEDAGDGSTGTGGNGGEGGDGTGIGGAGGTDYATPVTCTSGEHWTRGDQGHASMHPGVACIACHTKRNAPAFTVAGTMYATAHEPDDCNGVDGLFTGATVVIVDANGTTTTVGLNFVGSFNVPASTKIAFPFRAKVTHGTRERVMLTPQSSGDCNSCHTEAGANKAPGRIMLP